MAASEVKSLLVIIDPQVDFHEGGSLQVVGATADAQRLATFINTNAESISDIVVTMDTHSRMHVGHPTYWLNSEGNHPNPFTLIELAQIQSGEYTTSDPANLERAKQYVSDLEATGAFKLFIWPYHCITGSPGHNVQADILNALNDWTDTQHKSVEFMFKGMNIHTEMYSALKAEVPMEDDPSTQLNMVSIEKWQTYDKVIFCGQAKSHCVNFTVRDFVGNGGDPAKVVLLSDCQSAVASFEEQANNFFADMKEAGCTIKASTDTIFS